MRGNGRHEPAMERRMNPVALTSPGRKLVHRCAKDSPIITSFPKLFPAAYASRISEYAIPPAMNTITRCFASLPAPGRAARCQLGFALLKDVAPVEGVARREGAGASGGVSLT